MFSYLTFPPTDPRLKQAKQAISDDIDVTIPITATSKPGHFNEQVCERTVDPVPYTSTTMVFYEEATIRSSVFGCKGPSCTHPCHQSSDPLAVLLHPQVQIRRFSHTAPLPHLEVSTPTPFNSREAHESDVREGNESDAQKEHESDAREAHESANRLRLRLQRLRLRLLHCLALSSRKEKGERQEEKEVSAHLQPQSSRRNDNNGTNKRRRLRKRRPACPKPSGLRTDDCLSSSEDERQNSRHRTYGSDYSSDASCPPCFNEDKPAPWDASESPSRMRSLSLFLKLRSLFSRDDTGRTYGNDSDRTLALIPE